MGRKFREQKGSFKSYTNPCLTATNSSQLGYWIGPICVSCVCVPDDTYISSGDPRKLQGIIKIVGHYSKRYCVIIGPDKTKVTITR